MTASQRRDGKSSCEDFVVFTIVANNYLPYAITLMRSVKEQHPKSRRFIVLCDEKAKGVKYKGLPAEILYARDLGIPGFDSMAFVYDVMELATAIKPYTFLHLFDRYDAPGVLYIDPDIIVLRPLEHIAAPLKSGHTMVLTPHIMAPLQDGKFPDDLTIMKSGIYNLGFLGARDAPEIRSFIQWWADRCNRDAIVDIAEHKFTDQKWMDFAPAFVPGHLILRHPGYNIAYWNLHQRNLTLDGDRLMADGQPAHFVHFSGVVPNDITTFSKHQNRFQPKDVGALQPLFERYVGMLNENGYDRFHAIPYAYNSFTNGRKIHRTMRLSFRRHEDVSGFPGSLFKENGERFDQPEPSLAHLGEPYITRVMYEIWQLRQDLRNAFGVTNTEGRRRFAEWFCHRGHSEAKVDELSLDAATKLLRGDEPVEAIAPPPPPPIVEEEPAVEARFEPWERQTTEVFTGSRRDLDAWLAAPVPLNVMVSDAGMLVPRCFAMAWEERRDLQDFFRNDSMDGLESFLTWCITNGVKENSVLPPLVGDTLGPFLDANERVDPQPHQIPLTRLMRYMRPKYSGSFRPLLQSPDVELAAEVVALWLCDTARRENQWPRQFVQSLLDWFNDFAFAIEGEVPITNSMLTLYRLREDVRDAFDLNTSDGRSRFAVWYMYYGVFEFNLDPVEYSAKFVAWLGKPAGSTRDSALKNFHRLVWNQSRELQANFALGSAMVETALASWIDSRASTHRVLSYWQKVMRPQTEDAAAANTDGPTICLSGLWVASGRAEDLRMTAAALHAAKVDFVIFDRIKQRFHDQSGNPVQVDPRRIRVNVVHLNADTAWSDFLVFRRAGLEHAHTIGFWAWELARFPKSQRIAFSFVDEIWASTNFARKAFAAEKLRPVHLMPMPVQAPELLPKAKRADFGLPEKTFIFYYGFDFKSYVQRKNPEAAIEGFLAAFPKGKEKVMLFIKTLNGDKAPRHLEALQELANGDPRIVIRDEEMSYARLMTLISLCDCYVSTHRSEGFGRGPAEAMLLGVPVIATNYSGNVDFTTEETSFPVDYKLVDVKEGEYVGAQDQVWAEVDRRHLAKLMREVSSKSKVALAKAAAGKELMRSRFSAMSLAQRYARQIEESAKLYNPSALSDAVAKSSRRSARVSVKADSA